MNLTLETTLRGVAHALSERITPALSDSFAAEAARLAELLVTLCAGTVDNAAAVRVAENAAIRALFVDAAPLVADTGLSRRLIDAGLSSDPGLRIGELDMENGRLRTLLIMLHAEVERPDSAEARAVDQRIWRLLRDSEAARFPA